MLCSVLTSTSRLQMPTGIRLLFNNYYSRSCQVRRIITGLSDGCSLSNDSIINRHFSYAIEPVIPFIEPMSYQLLKQVVGIIDYSNDIGTFKDFRL